MFAKAMTPLLVLSMTLVIASGCAGSTPATDSFCLVAPRITTSVDDTEETKRQVDKLWAIAEELDCGWLSVEPRDFTEAREKARAAADKAVGDKLDFQ